MQKLKSDLLPKIRLQGYCTASSLAVESNEVQALYETFDRLIQEAQAKEILDQIIHYDNYIKKMVAASELNLHTSDLSLEKIVKGGSFNHITSFQYLKNLTPEIRPPQFSFTPFLQQLEKVVDNLKQRLQLLIDIPECVYILKISKYNKAPVSTSLMPFHFDRTLFTVIVDTKESSSGHLALQNNEKIHVVKAAELPMVFTGHEGLKTFGVAPTSHGVINFSEEEKNPVRFSLILFIFSKDSLK